MSAFDDMQGELETGKKACDMILATDVPEKAEAITDCTTWNIEWFKEDMPLENAEGTSLFKEVRDMAAAACYSQAGEMPRIPPPDPEDILVFADQEGFITRVLEKVPEGRIESKKIVTKPPALLTVEDIQSLLSAKTYDLIVVSNTVDQPKSNEVKDVLEQQTACAKFMFQLLQQIYLKEGCCKRLAVFTHDIFSEQADTNAERGLSITTNGTMYGMLNTARIELEFPVQLIDTELLDCRELMPHLAAELFRKQAFGVNTVRHCYPFPVKNGRRTDRPFGRHVVRQMPSKEYKKADVKFEVPAEGLVAITGGNGALGLVMGMWMLEYVEKEKAASGGSYNPKFTIQFLSRSMKIGDLNMPTWKKIQMKAEEMGIKVEQAAMDMSSQASVDKYFAENVSQLTGIIHAAGILQDSMLPNQTWEKFEAVYSGKHWAALYMHNAMERLGSPKLKFFWMFSSTSVQGNMGQINYSSSNAYMDALARHRLALGKPACAMQWGAWGEVGMAASMDDAMRRRVMSGPMPYFTVKQGLEGLEGGLKTGLPGFSVFIVNPMVFYGMISGDASPTQRYMRNFSCEWMPTPAPYAMDEDNAYNMYRMYRYVAAPYTDNEALVFDKYIKPTLPAPAAEEEEDIVLGNGLC